MARAIAWVASVWFALVACWEIAGPFGSGHVAASAAVGIAGENMFRWGMLAPVTQYTLTEPPPSDYYCHHPWGIFWTTAGLVRLFGHHDWVCRLAPVLMSSATPPLLYAIGRALWGPVPGALAASCYAVLPIALAFANFNALEVPVIFGVLLVIWGVVRFTQTWQRRWMLLSLVGLLHALNSDWPAFIFAGVLLLLALPRLLLLNGRGYPKWDVRESLIGWLLAVSICASVVLFYAYQLARTGHWERLIAQAQIRALGSDVPLAEVLTARAHWIDLSFTPLAILLGKLAVPVLLLRVVACRRDLEAMILAVLVMALVQYVVFRQGADVHIFWPHYFAPYFALAMGALADSAQGLTRRASRAWGAPRGLGPAVALGLCLPVPICILPDGIHGLRYARMTGGRFDEKGLLIHQDIDKSALMKWLASQLPHDATVAIHTSAKYSWSLSWSLGRPASVLRELPMTPAQGEHQVLVADARFASAELQTRLAMRFRPRVVGPFWVVDRAVPAGPLDGYSFARREPNPLQWYLLQGHDPILRIVADRYHTWELRQHFGQRPNPPPTEPVQSREQLRILHNLAVASADHALVAQLRNKIEVRLDRSCAAKLTEGIELLGTVFEPSVAPRLVAYFRASGPTQHAHSFVIQSRVQRKRTLSSVPPDDKERLVGMPFAIPTTLWQPHFIYTSSSEIRQRPGAECYSGYLDHGAGARPRDRRKIHLLCLP